MKILRKMTEKDPANRYRLWDELVIDLSLVARGESPLGAAIAGVERVRLMKGKCRLFVAATGGIAVLAALIFFLVRGPARSSTPVRDPAEVEARTELDMTLRILAKRPEDEKETLDSLRTIVHQFPGTAASREASSRAAEIERRIRTREEQEARTVESEVRAQIGAGEYDRAREALAAARRRLSEDAALELAGLDADLTRSASGRLAQGKKEVAALLGAGRFSAARKTIESMPDVSEAGIGKWRRSALEQVRSAQEKAEKERRTRTLKAYRKALVRALGMALNGRGKEAERVLTAGCGKGDRSDVLGDHPKVDRGILAGVGSALVAGLAGARAKAGKDVALVADGSAGQEVIVGTIESAGGKGIRIAGREKPIPWNALDNATVSSLAPSLPPSDLAAHALARGETKRVARILDGDVSREAGRLKKLAAQVPARPLRLSVCRSATSPRDPAAARKLDAQGLDAYALGHLAKAVETFEAAQAADPESGDIRLGLAPALLDLYRQNRSIVLRDWIVAELRQVAELSPDLAKRNHVSGLIRQLIEG